MIAKERWNDRERGKGEGERCRAESAALVGRGVEGEEQGAKLRGGEGPKGTKKTEEGGRGWR